MSPQESPGKDVRVSHEINTLGPQHEWSMSCNGREYLILQRIDHGQPVMPLRTHPKDESGCFALVGEDEGFPRIEDALRACGEDAGLSPDSAFVVFHAHGERRFPFVPEKEEA